MKLKHPLSGWKPNRFVCKMIGCSVAIAYTLVLVLALYTLAFQQGQGFINNYNICTKVEDPQSKTGLAFTVVLILGSLLLAIVLSVALDIFGLWKLRQLEKNQPNHHQSAGPNQIQPYVPTTQSSSFPERRIIDEMPIRSSLINTLFLFPYLFIIVVLWKIGRKFNRHERRLLISIPYLVMSIFRTLLVATLTFRKNGSNRQRNADEEREQLRMIEIEHALKKRQNRKEGKFVRQTLKFSYTILPFRKRIIKARERERNLRR